MDDSFSGKSLVDEAALDEITKVSQKISGICIKPIRKYSFMIGSNIYNICKSLKNSGYNSSSQKTLK